MNLDREIEDLLAVDPSPEFVAKVRMRITAEPEPVRPWPSWRLLSIGAGLAVVVLGAWLAQPARPVPAAPSAGTAATASASAGSAATAVPIAADGGLGPAEAGPYVDPIDPVRTPNAHASAAERVAVTPNAERASEVVEVLVPTAEAQALELLLARVRDGQLPDMTESLAAVDAAGPAWIAIAPVVIDPIPQAEGE